jgi:hypothetical protein
MDEFEKPPRRPAMYATQESANYELRFQSLFHEGRGYAFDCDAEGYVDVRGIGPIPVKGLAEPVEVYELTGAGSARTRLQAARARGLTRFVGRDTELDSLRHAAEQAHAGRGQLVAVVGEPGVGKSRLYYEFIHSHHVEGWLVLESGSVSYGKATPYLPLADLLRSYFKIDTPMTFAAFASK